MSSNIISLSQIRLLYPRVGIYVQTNTGMFYNYNEENPKQHNFLHGILRCIRELLYRDVLHLEIIFSVDINNNVNIDIKEIRKYVIDNLMFGLRWVDYEDLYMDNINGDINEYIKQHVHILYPSEHIHATVGRNMIFNYIRRKDFNFFWFGSDDDDLILPTPFMVLIYNLYSNVKIELNPNKLNINGSADDYIFYGHSRDEYDKLVELKHKSKSIIDILTNNTKGSNGKDIETKLIMKKIHDVSATSYNNINDYIILHHTITTTNTGITGGAVWCYLINPCHLQRYSFRCLPFNKEDIEFFMRFIEEHRVLLTSYLLNMNVISPYVYTMSNNSGMKGVYNQSVEDYLNHRSEVNKTSPLAAKFQQSTYKFSIPEYGNITGTPIKYYEGDNEVNKLSWDKSYLGLTKLDNNQTTNRYNNTIILNLKYNPPTDKNKLKSDNNENYNGDLYMISYDDSINKYYMLQNGYYILDSNDYKLISEFMDKNIISLYYDLLMNPHNMDNNKDMLVEQYNSKYLRGVYGNDKRNIPNELIGGYINIWLVIVILLVIICVIVLYISSNRNVLYSSQRYDLNL